MRLLTALSLLLCQGAAAAAPAGSAAVGLVRGRVAAPGGAAGVVVFLVPTGFELPAAAPRPPAAISQKDATFDPSLLVVEAGRTVDFVNDDSIDHNVFSFSSAKKFDLGLYPKGEEKSVKFDVPGPVLVFCSIHESMSAVVYVAPNRLFAVTAPDGSFSIGGVPAGRYHLRTWHTALPDGVEFVEVKDVDIASSNPVEVLIDLAASFVPAVTR